MKNLTKSRVAYAVIATLGLMSTKQAFAETQINNGENIEVIEVVGSVSRFGATKSNTPIVETARSLSIESFDAFTEKGALNLSQAASYMPGVSAETFGFATRGDWIRSRGLEVPKYRDSIQELFGSYNTTKTELYTLEQVEVLRGPASVLYGQGSPGGIVNYVSKTPRAETKREVNLQMGTHSRTQLGLDLNGALTQDESIQGRFVGLYRDSDTQVDYVEDDTVVLMPSLKFFIGEDTQFTIIGLYQDTDSDTASQFIPVQGTLFPLEDGSYLDQDVYAGEPEFNRFNTKATQVTVLGEHNINDSLTLSGTALWRDGEADYHQAWPTFLGDGQSRYLNDIVGLPVAIPTTVPRSFYQADNTFEQIAFDLRLSGVFTTGEIEHELLTGVQFQDVKTDNNFSYFYGGGALSGDFSYVLDLANPVYTGAPAQAIFDAIYTDNPVQKVEDLGIYLSDQMSYGNWRATIGIRYDEVDNDNGVTTQKDDATSISGGILYAFDNGMSPYINYAESFETVVGTTPDNQQLKPEEATQIEVGVKYVPDSFPGYFTLAYFDIEISNLPNPNSLPIGGGQQQGKSDLSGFEFEGKFNAGDFDIQLAYSTLDAEDPNGFELAGTPDGGGSVWVTWEPTDMWQGFRAGAGVRHVGKSISETASLRYETPSYTLGDLMIGYEFSNNLDVAINVRNVTDKEYLTSCLTRGDCFPGVRRTVMGNITYAF